MAMTELVTSRVPSCNASLLFYATVAPMLVPFSDQNSIHESCKNADDQRRAEENM